MKKIISLVLAFIMAFSCFGLFAAAEDSVYTPDYDKNTPVVVLHGIGQNDTYILDENGNRMVDSNGDYINGWPLEIDVNALLANVLPNLFFSILTRRDNGLSNAMKDGAYDLLYAVHKDNEGNYYNDVE